MKLMEFDPAAFSKNVFLIGGINTYIYNLDRLTSQGLDSSLHSLSSSIEQEPTSVKVLYLIHEREGSYKFTESVAYTVLKNYYENSNQKSDLICVTFDVRNHGERIIDSSKNTGWTEGNLTHALDMLSFIDGAVQDLKLIIDYLPSYLESNNILTKNFKLSNYITGYSLGGHVTIRFASSYPSLVSGIIPVVGCSDLSSLLINRLKKVDVNSQELGLKLFKESYKDLKLTTEQSILYPRTFYEYLSVQDKKIFNEFDFQNIKIFAIFGERDTLVPPKFSESWLSEYKENNKDVIVFIQEGVGHETTLEMLHRYSDWLVGLE